MGCDPAPTCRAALAEATGRWPGRNRASDGICGDARHQASVSDHNLGNAFDLTHDPARGVDAHGLVEGMKQRRDPRVKYIISNRRIWNPSVSPHWRPYNGSNPHEKHAHVSIKAGARGDTSRWWGSTPGPSPTPTPGPARCPEAHPTIQRGERSSRVNHLQYLLTRTGAKIAGDGDFGPGTESALVNFQRWAGIGVDGVCGPTTWRTIHRLVDGLVV